MVLTTKFRPLKPPVWEEYTTSFMHIFCTNKVPRVVLQFLWTGTHLGGEGTNVPHELGTAGPPGTTGLAGAANPAGAVGPARWGCTYPVPRPQSQSSPSSRAQLGWTRLIKEMLDWPNGWSCNHLDQWVLLSGRSTATTVIPRQSWASPSKGGSSQVGWPYLEGRPQVSTAITAKIDARNRPSTASGARIRSIEVKRQWIIGPATPLDPATPVKMGPRAQPTSLTYKRSLTTAGSNTQRWSISFHYFIHLE
jgi:hypothetical protein